MVQNRNIENEIMLHLLRGESHVREIAKTIHEPHPTVSRKLSNLVKENAIDFKIEGRNKVFFLKKNSITKNYVLNAEHYKLNKLFKRYPEMLVLVEEIQQKTPSLMALIFGSYAKGRAKKESDIDIYIETKDQKLQKDLESLHSKLNVKIGLFDLKSNLIKEIIKNHVILKGYEEFYERIGFFKETV